MNIYTALLIQCHSCKHKTLLWGLLAHNISFKTSAIIDCVEHTSYPCFLTRNKGSMDIRVYKNFEKGA